MKKYVLILLVMFILFPTYVDAKVVTYPRDENNFGVNDKIEITESNKDNILNTPKVDANEKVYDFANLFTDSEEKDLYKKVKAYISDTNMDMVIVSIDTNNKVNTLIYAQDFYDYNDFGTDDKFSGIILVLDMQNRRIEIATTGDAMLYYDDERINDIIDYFYDDVKDGNYFAAMKQFISKSLSYFNKGIPPTNEDFVVDDNGDLVPLPKTKTVAWGAAFLGGIIIAIVVVIIMTRSHKNIALATNATRYIDLDSIKYYQNVDRFVSTHTSTVYIAPPPPSSGSSNGAGSSISHGSSGRSHGGGGRNF